ncbi:MAG TPA: hypothetical protein VHC20_02585 [Candidatus Paceibacterota bacterium]|nr:hypothetical protein [Candidatus Paceibacterota bacterium]
MVGGIALLALIMGVIFMIGRQYFGLEVVTTNPGTDVTAWSVFRAPIEHFEIKFPSTPSESTGSFPATSTLDAVPYTEYAAKDVNGDYYAVSVETFPTATDVSNASAFLESIVSASATDAHATAVKTQDGRYGTYPSVDYSYKSGTYYLRARAVLVGHSVYFVQLVSGGNTFPSFDAFAATLVLTGAA